MKGVINMGTMRSSDVLTEQDRHCAYKVTLRRVRSTIVPVDKQ